MPGPDDTLFQELRQELRSASPTLASITPENSRERLTKSAHAPPPFSRGESVSANAAPDSASSHASSAGIDDLARIFNTTLVASLAGEARDFPGEFYQLMESPAFRAILNSIQLHARAQGITVRQATEQVIETFRKAESLWRDYIYREGMDRVGGAGN